MNTLKNKSLILGRLAVVGAACLATVALVPVADAGRGATHNELAGVVRNGNVDAIIAKLEKAENMISTKRTIALVEGLLSHDDYRAREAASWWFARRAFHQKRLTQQAVATLAGSDSLAIRNAADMLGTFRHPQVVSALSAVVTRTSLTAEARMAAVRGLGIIGHMNANPAIASAMGDSDATVRAAAIEAWSKILHQATAAEVVPLLADSSLDVRRAASRTLGRFTETSARARLETMLQSDADIVSRRNAAYALGKIGDSASRAVLTSASQNDESALVRAYAKRALRTVGL